MWAATLVDGIRSYLYGDKSDYNVRKDECWFLDDSSHHVGSFCYICEVLGIEADKLRSFCFHHQDRMEELFELFRLRWVINE